MTTAGAPRSTLASAIHRWLFDPEFAGGFHREVERAVALLIVASVFAVALEQSAGFHQAHAVALHAFDLFMVALFTIEYALRALAAPALPEFASSRFPRLRYACSFYAVVDLLAIAPFYVGQFVAVDLELLRMLRLMRLLRMAKLARQLLPAIGEFRQLNAGRTLRQKVFALLEPTGHSGRLHILLDNFIMFWIGLSILCVVLESVDELAQMFGRGFAWIDMIAFTIFTVEYIARVYCAPENPLFANRRLPRLALVRMPQAVIDLLAILPTLLEPLLKQHVDLRFLRVFRLLRLLKMTRYTSSTVTLLKVVRREWHIIAAAVFVMLLLVVLTASLGYVFEHDAQPDKFDNILQAIYWAVVTLASVGYGDISPVTPMGRLLTVVLALVGIGIFAIPAGLLASAFTDQLRIDRESFRHLLQKCYEDGVADPREEQAIVAEAERLHLSGAEFERLVEEAQKAFRLTLEAEEMSFGHLMLDANAHPEFAAEQFRIMVAQLQLLLRATGEQPIASRLDASGQGEAALRVLRVLAQGDGSERQGKPAEEADSKQPPMFQTRG